MTDSKKTCLEVGDSVAVEWQCKFKETTGIRNIHVDLLRLKRAIRAAARIELERIVQESGSRITEWTEDDFGNPFFCVEPTVPARPTGNQQESDMAMSKTPMKKGAGKPGKAPPFGKKKAGC